MRLTRTLPFALMLLTAGSLISVRPAAAQYLYDASADFSATSNPNPLDGGVWSYGEEATLGGPFTLYTTTESSSNGFLQGWTTAVLPALLENTSGAVYTSTANGSTITVNPGQMDLHPGANGQYSILRFTAPTTSTYSFSGDFSGVDSHPTTTDVHVLANNLSVADGGINVNSGGNTASLASSSLLLTAGETLDFAVGFGNSNYTYDSTGLYAKVTDLSPAAVPEASTTVSFGLLLALGMGGAVIAARKKKAAASA